MYNYTYIVNNIQKRERRRILEEIIARGGTGDQRRILEEMKRRGIRTTQATVSRDLHDLGLTKVRRENGDTRYERLGRASEKSVWDRLRVMFLNFVVGIKSTGNLLLVRTTPGNANGVASLIDALERPEILGTVAGDDTILVIVETAVRRKSVERDFQALLAGLAKPIHS